ncbi:hypothetical protein GCM10010272_17170 [Streptomyces lateritius]|nr:hypothetical protein GCM10010272_17170 [Streptomyces lateritius]
MCRERAGRGRPAVAARPRRVRLIEACAGRRVGLTQVTSAASSAPTNTDANFVITVKSAEVHGEQNIRIILPSDYAANPGKRYPVLYFLHGSPDDPSMPFYGNTALTGASGMITIVPDGGNRGSRRSTLRGC